MLSDMVAGAIRDVTGVEAELSTTGGTSDARFLSRLCPVVEFGLNNATMHKLDEAVALADLRDLAEIYRLVTAKALARSEERRVGKECVSTCRSRWSPYP